MVVVVGAPSAERQSTTSALREARFEVCELDHRRDLRGLASEQVGCVVFDPVVGASVALVNDLPGDRPAPPLVLTCGRQHASVVVRSLGLSTGDGGERAFDLALLEQVGAALRCAAQRRDAMRLQARLQKRLKRLSERRRRILASIVAGRSSSEIGRELGIGRLAVEGHLGHIMRALGLETAAGLLRAVLDAAESTDSAARVD